MVWKATDLKTLTDLYAAWGSGGNDVWAIGSFATYMHFIGAWKKFDTMRTEFVRGAWGFGASDVWAVGTGGPSIFHWDGKLWQPTESIPPEGPQMTEILKGVWGSATNDIWAVGDHGFIDHYKP